MSVRLQRGDTLVELILAVAIFSLAAISAIVVMNKGLAISQNGLEVTLVRAQMDSQAEMIRYLRDTSDGAWGAIKSYATGTTVAPLSPATCPTSSDIAASATAHGFFVARDPATGAFMVQDVDATHFESAATYAKIDYDAQKTYGVWVQAARAENATSNGIEAYDMYIHACWDSVATENAPATLGTIVRIYDK